MHVNFPGSPPVTYTKVHVGDQMRITRGEYAGQFGVIEKFNGYWSTDNWSAQVRLDGAESAVRIIDMHMTREDTNG